MPSTNTVDNNLDMPGNREEAFFTAWLKENSNFVNLLNAILLFLMNRTSGRHWVP